MTGSRGFIGGHVVRHLTAEGCTVLGLHRGGGAQGETTHIACDLTAPSSDKPLGQAVASVDAVLHAAAHVQLWGRSRDVVEENCEMTRRVVEACERAGRPKLVFLSSASVAYRPCNQHGIDLDTPLPRRALNAYAAAKVACEAIVRSYRGPWSILRPQAVIGPGDRHLLPPILDAARRGKWVWLGTRNAAQADLLSIENLVHCCSAALRAREERGTWYLSDGAPTPMKPLLREVFQRAGLRVTERRLPAVVARGFAGVVETAYRVFARNTAPPVHRFGIESITRTRTIDPTRMLERFGPLPVTFRGGFEAAMVALER